MTNKRKSALFRAADKVFGLLLWFALLLAAGCALAGVVGCASPQQPEQSWPPDASFRAANVSGSLELATPAGPVTVDLSTGIVGGDGGGGVEVVRVEVAASASFEVNGLAQELQIISPGSRAGDGAWAQCVAADGIIGVMRGVALLLRARPPGLHDSCGGAIFEVSTVFRPYEPQATTP